LHDFGLAFCMMWW